jgi:hypothetical protein
MLLAGFFPELLQEIGRQRNHHLRSRIHDQSPLAVNVTNLWTITWAVQFACQALVELIPSNEERLSKSA